MAIPETQLDTWSKQGSVAQSQSTYATVRNAIDASDAPYAGKSYQIFLQGSYGNDTNIYADSDVDVVIRLDAVYYEDTSNLSATDLAAYKAAFSAASYGYNDFKRDVIAQLTKKFGVAVQPGSKAIFVQGTGTRRDADVLAAAQFRKYTRFASHSNQQYVEGITFWTSSGEQIINYPKQHSANCTTKHQNTASWFKPMVRVLKNMRNSMVAKGYLAEGVAPSYFVEGMLYNVPNAKFGRSYGDTFAEAINWLSASDHSKLLCANEQYYLCNATSPVTWRAEKLQAYLDAAAKFWKEW